MNIQEHLIKKCKCLIPPLTQNLHKGQNGRIGIIGGCEEYTGAPYYAAISALRTGADLVYVFCFKSAAPIIKSFSPELIVLPYLDSPNAVEKIKPWLKKLHSLVVGPGLGNDPIAHDSVRKIFQHVSGDRDMNDIHLPIIVDADSLNLVEPESFKNYNGHIYLTPNVVEFSKLSKRLIGHEVYKPTQDNIKAIINKLNGKYVIVLKGEKDIIVDDKGAVVNSQQGSARRCGGQGDILAGSMGTFAYWATKVENYDVNNLNPEVLAAYAASSLTKHSNKVTFELKGRHMITTDIIKHIPTAFQDLFEHCDN